MTKTEAQVESQSLACSNPKCKKAFSNPIIVEDLSLKGAGTYQACPYCLTEVAVEAVKGIIEAEDEKLELRTETRTSEDLETRESKLSPERLKEDGCFHHFGYLSQRSKSEGIPEECMTCSKIVQCMLKNVTS